MNFNTYFIFCTEGTHDIQYVAISDQIFFSLSVEYVDYSEARGAFCVLLPIRNNGTVNFRKLVYVIVDRNSSNSQLQIIPPRGQYFLSVFDLEKGGVLQDNMIIHPATTMMYNASGGKLHSCANTHMFALKAPL